jgi:hypothetical protein
MTAHQKPPAASRAVRVGYGLRKSPAVAAQDREDAKSAARAQRELKAGTFDGISLDELAASVRRDD